MKTPEAMLADALTLVAQHEQTIGALADVAKVARDALAEAEIALERERGMRAVSAKSFFNEQRKVEWMRAEILKLAGRGAFDDETVYGFIVGELKRIAAGPPTKDPT